MGLTPRQLDAMTLWEFSCAASAWRKFHTVESEDEDRPPEMSDERLAELGIIGFTRIGNGSDRQQ
jgi:hypothetical protein